MSRSDAEVDDAMAHLRMCAHVLADQIDRAWIAAQLRAATDHRSKGDQ